MNLSTARATRRAKEIGIKKAVGAEKRVLIRQFLGESLLITFLSFGLALIAVFLLLPFFNELTEKQNVSLFWMGDLDGFPGTHFVHRNSCW